MTKVSRVKEVEKLIKIAQKYGLKTLEVSGDYIKIDMNEQQIGEKKQRKSAKEQAFTKEENRQAYLDALQLMDPEMYEEELIKQDGGLKEIS